MTIDVADIALLRRNHRSDDAFLRRCYTCYQKWPCITTELLDAYEEREQFNKTLAAVCNTVIELQTERDRLRAALKRIAFEDELVYLGCADMPFCHDPHTNTKQCPVAVARAALEGRE